MELNKEQLITILYTNYRGETAHRHIIPRKIHFASTKWHPESQWLLNAYDCDRKAERSFAMRDIAEWKNN